MPKSQTMLTNLFREFWQTEESASRHPYVEAERLGSVPPSHAMRAVAGHAQEVLRELTDVAQRHDLPVSAAGKALGSAFSRARRHFADLVLDVERSYRGTLLGMRHGINLAELMLATARAEQNPELVTFFDRWLTTRRPLVEACSRELEWFARNPERALAPVATAPWSRSAIRLGAVLRTLSERRSRAA